MRPCFAAVLTRALERLITDERLLRDERLLADERFIKEERLLRDWRDSMAGVTDGSGHVNDLSWRIIGAAIEVHRELGPGLMESTYEACLAEEMMRRGLSFSRQHHFPVFYKDRVLRSRYRLDFLVEERVIVELKCVDRFDPIHTAQMLTYLNLTGCYLGLLINFNVRILKAGIRRIIRGVPTPLPSPCLPRE